MAHKTKAVKVEALFDTYDALYRMERILRARNEKRLVAKVNRVMEKVGIVLEPFLQEFQDRGG